MRAKDLRSPHYAPRSGRKDRRGPLMAGVMKSDRASSSKPMMAMEAMPIPAAIKPLAKREADFSDDR